jgi:hypothetical protein
MKTTNTKVRLASIAAMIFLMIGMSNQVQATGTAKSQMAIQYVGKVESLPIFLVQLNNTEEDEFSVVIKDVDDVVLYSETLKGTNVTRKYGFDVEANDLSKLRVVITSKKTNESQVYSVNKSSYLVENVAVAKL